MATIIQQSIEDLVNLRAALAEAKQNLKPNQQIICAYDTETTGLAANKREMKQEKQDYIDKIIEVGAVFAIKETDENGNSRVVPLQDENGADLGFRQFYNPWLNGFKNFPEQMSQILVDEVHGVTRGVLEGREELIVKDKDNNIIVQEKLENPAPSINSTVKLANDEETSYIAEIVQLFNMAEELVAHNAPFDMGMINAAIQDQNDILKKEHLKTQDKRLEPFEKELAKKESRLEKMKSGTQKEALEQEISLIEDEMKEIKRIPTVGYYEGKVIDTVVVFRNTLPERKQMAMQSREEVASPVNMKLDTLMRITGLDERTMHGAYWDSKLLIDSYSVLLNDYINKDEEVKRIATKVDYISRFGLDYEDGETVLSSKQEEAKLMNEMFVNNIGLPSSDFIASHVEKQLDNINKRIQKEENKGTMAKFESSYEFLMQLIGKNFPAKISTLEEMSKVVEKVKLPKLKKGEVKETAPNLNMVKTIYGLIAYEIQNTYADNLINREKELDQKIKQISDPVNVSSSQTYNYFRTDATVPTKKAKDLIMVGSTANFKKLFQESIDRGVNELTLMDANVISNMYYVKKALKSFNENNTSNPITLKYGLTTSLLLPSGDRIEFNISPKNDEGVANLTNILTKVYQNDDVEPYLTLEDIGSGILDNAEYTFGSYQGIVENTLFNNDYSPLEAKKRIFANIESLLAVQDSINLEFYESDGFLNEYKSNLVEALRKKYPNKTINKIFTNPILYNKGDKEMHNMRSLGLGQEVYDRQGVGIVEDTGLIDEINNEYVDINNVVGGDTPKEEVIIPDFIGDLDFIKEKYPKVYKKLETSVYEDSSEPYDLEDNSKENVKRIQTDYYLKVVNEKYEETIAKLNLSDEDKKIYKERLDYENEIIIKMGFDGYTLLVADFIDILVNDLGGLSGPGRGSAAGSFVSYCLGITAVDPIKNGLLFERYLNPERVSLPDIDMDMQGDVKKSKLLGNEELPKEYRDYIASKYANDEILPARDLLIDFVRVQRGEDTVVNIVTRGTMKPKSAIDLVCKELGNEFALESGYKFFAGDTPYIEFAKIIKGNWFEVPGISFDDVLFDEENKSFANLYNSNVAVRKVVDLARKIENTISHYGVHAAGVVFLNKQDGWLGNAIMNIGGTNTTAIDGKFIEDTTGIKFDFLGLASLNVIENTMKIVGATKGKEEEKHIVDTFADETLLYKDPLTYLAIIMNSYEIFQFASDGMAELNLSIASSVEGVSKEKVMDNLNEYGIPAEKVSELEENGTVAFMMEKGILIPENWFEVAAAATALYRPGPMQSGMTESFVARKKELEEISYVFPEMEEILKDTYGTMVYQEQVMQIVQTIGGFSLGGADIVRRGMGKKDEALLQSLKKEFVEGAVKIYKDQSTDDVKDKASDLFDLILKFAGYGFNKSHSVAYTNVSARMAYLKAHYPKEFFTAVLLNRQDEIEKIEKVVVDLKTNGLDLKGADINRSMVNFQIRDDEIIYGLDVIKGTNTNDMKEIIESRQKDGEFKTFNEFLKRVKYGVDAINISKTSMEGLIISGALDKLEMDNIQIEGMDEDLQYNLNVFKNDNLRDSKSIKRALMLRTFRYLETPSPKVAELKKIEQEYEDNKSILFMSASENAKTGSYSAIENPLENQDIKDQIKANKGIDTAFDLINNPLEEEGDFVFNAIIKKVKSGENKMGDDFVSFEVVDINGIMKMISLSASQVKEYKENVQDGAMVKLNVNVSVSEKDDGSKRAYLKINEMSVYDDKNEFREMPVIEKDKYSLKDIDTNVLHKELLVEITKIEEMFNNSQYGYDGGGDKKEFVSFLKGYRSLLTKKGKPMSFLELGDGINKKTITVVHFGELDETALDKNLALPIKYTLGKKKDKFGMGTAFNSSVIVVGEDGLKKEALERELKSANGETKEKEEVVEEVVEYSEVDYDNDFSSFYTVKDNATGDGFIIELNVSRFKDKIEQKGDDKYLLGYKLYVNKRIYVNNEDQKEDALAKIQELIGGGKKTKQETKEVEVVEERVQITKFTIKSDKNTDLTYKLFEENKYKLVEGEGANDVLMISEDTMYEKNGIADSVVIVGIPSIKRFDLNVVKTLVSYSTIKQLSGFMIETKNDTAGLEFKKEDGRVYITNESNIKMELTKSQIEEIIGQKKRIENVKVILLDGKGNPKQEMIKEEIVILEAYPQYDEPGKKKRVSSTLNEENQEQPRQD